MGITLANVVYLIKYKSKLKKAIYNIYFHMQDKNQSNTKTTKSHYDILGVKQDATNKDIDEAYKKLST